MLHICIPTYNEGPTVGVLLWRIRKVFQEYSREYEVIVYDDGSTDETAATLEPYCKVLPLTVLHGEKQEGFGHALNALCADVSRRTKYPRRDAMVVMQGDFTDQPEALPELLKRFEGGADIVTTDGWAANLEMFLKLAPLARKVEKVAVAPRYDLRPRETRVRPFADAMG